MGDFPVIFEEVKEVQPHNGRTSVANLTLYSFRSRNGMVLCNGRSSTGRFGLS